MSRALLLSLLLVASLPVDGVELDEGSEQSTAELDPVRVTANKRDQLLSEVAGSLTVIGGQELEERHLLDYGDLLNQVPGVSYQQATPGVSNITVRGISVGDFEITYGAAVYFDEAPLTSSRFLGFSASSTDLRLVDIERIEILRGSQGTLYGANSISGVVRVISNAPDPLLAESRVSAGLSTVSEGGIGAQLTGMTNIPVMDGDAAFRIVGYYFDDPGFIDNVTTGIDDVGGSEVAGLRLSFGWEPDPELSVQAQFISQSHDSIDAPWVISAPTLQTYDPPVNILAHSPPQHNDLDLLNLTVRYSLDGLELISVTSYSRRDALQQRALGFIDITDPTEGVTSLYTDPSTYLSQELRLRSTGDGDWSWIGGVWYADLGIDAGQRIFDVQDATICGVAALPAGCDVIYDVAFDTDLSELGLFGEATYRISEDWSVTGGARWFRTRDQHTQTALTDTALQSGVIQYRGRDVDVDPKLAVEYRGIDGWLLYARADRGHKPGFGTLVPPVGVCGVVPGAQESVRRSTAISREIGARFTAADFRSRLAIALYDIDWSDLQLLSTAPCGFAYWFNTSRASSRGMELEYTGMLSDDWTIDLALANNRSQLEAPTPFGGAPGDELPHSPEWLIHAGLQRALPGSLDGFIRLDLTHIGSSASSSPAYGAPPGMEEGGFTLLDLGMGVSLGESLWLLGGIRNVTDVREPIYISAGWADINLGDFGYASLTQPRTIYATISYGF